MPWLEVSAVDQREEFVRLALLEGSNLRELCRRYGVSPTTGYKWLDRHAAFGRAGLVDRPRRPHVSPGRTGAAMEATIVALRDRHPAWGARKLRRRLLDTGEVGVPSIATVNAVLQRHGRIAAAASAAHRRFVSFERAEPNDLWQMDFKGHFGLGGEGGPSSGRCHPLTVLDDHSRFNLGLRACPDERWTTVRDELVALFRRYGLPSRMLADNGPPWGDDADSRHTRLTVWLLVHDVAIVHGRPYHPQTQGKAERFHRSLVDELVGREHFADLDQCQHRFDAWRDLYNTERPHQGIGMAVPISRYRPSARTFPEIQPPVEYDAGAILRRVDDNGRIQFRGQTMRVGKAFQGHKVEVTPTEQDGCFTVRFKHHAVANIDMRTQQ